MDLAGDGDGGVGGSEVSVYYAARITRTSILCTAHEVPVHTGFRTLVPQLTSAFTIVGPL